MIELLQQLRLLDPLNQTDQVGDILMVDGRIAEISPQIADPPAQATIQDCRGLVLGPGLVDLYSHSGEPGFEGRETLESLTAAAIAGGFTRINLLPDTQPALDHPGGVERLRSRFNPQLPLRLHLWGAITQQLKGEQMTELAELATVVLGFSDGRAITNLGLLRRVLEYLKPLKQPIALWPCQLDLVAEGVIREGSMSLRLGLPGNPASAETTALAALLELVELVQTPVHIMRVSTARSVALIQQAKEKGLPITASTPWMHLLLNTEAIASFDPNLRLEPPLGNPADQQALISGVKTGVIDAIAIDHAAYTYEEKTVSFAEAPPGAIGLELALPLLWQNLVATGEWTALELWQALSTRPAQCVAQTPATLTPGQPAELTLFDPQQEWLATPKALKSLSSNTPWLNKTLKGRVLKTWGCFDNAL